MFNVENLNLKFNNFSLKDISFSIEDKSYFVILGESGSGKTVLLESIAGRYNLDSGKVIHNDKVLSSLPCEKRNIGFVYQNYELFPHMSVKDNILFGLKFRNNVKNQQQRLDYISDIFKIGHILKRFPDKLSGGEKQRVSFARALIINPDILILDEPFSALDMNIKPKLQSKLKKIQKDLNLTIIHVTHDVEEAMYFGDKIAIMTNGRLKVLKDKKDLEEEEFLKDYFQIRRKNVR